ncbi:MAG: hypothetical protein ACXVDC_12415 [Bacteroidia bacterium]
MENEMPEQIKSNVEEKLPANADIANIFSDVMNNNNFNNQPFSTAPAHEEIKLEFKLSVDDFLHARGLTGDEILSNSSLSFSVTSRACAETFIFYNPHNRQGVASNGFEWDGFDDYENITARIESGELIRKMSGFILKKT